MTRHLTWSRAHFDEAWLWLQVVDDHHVECVQLLNDSIPARSKAPTATGRQNVSSLWAPRAKARLATSASTEPNATQLIATSATRNAAISTVQRQGQLCAWALGGAGAIAFATSFCVGRETVGRETAVDSSATGLPFNGCGSVVGATFSHVLVVVQILVRARVRVG